MSQPLVTEDWEVPDAGEHCGGWMWEAELKG